MLGLGNGIPLSVKPAEDCLCDAGHISTPFLLRPPAPGYIARPSLFGGRHAKAVVLYVSVWFPVALSFLGFLDSFSSEHVLLGITHDLGLAVPRWRPC